METGLEDQPDRAWKSPLGKPVFDLHYVMGPRRRMPGLEAQMGPGLRRGGVTAPPWKLLRCTVPAPPGTERLRHDEPLVRFTEPRQFLGEHRHAMAPGTGHLCDVRAPEHPVGAERIVDLSQICVQR